MALFKASTTARLCSPWRLATTSMEQSSQLDRKPNSSKIVLVCGYRCRTSRIVIDGLISWSNRSILGILAASQGISDSKALAMKSQRRLPVRLGYMPQGQTGLRDLAHGSKPSGKTRGERSRSVGWHCIRRRRIWSIARMPSRLAPPLLPMTQSENQPDCELNDPAARASEYLSGGRNREATIAGVSD